MLNTWYYTKSHTHPEQYYESSQWWTKNIRNTKGTELFKKKKKKKKWLHRQINFRVAKFQRHNQKTFILCKPMSRLKEKDLSHHDLKAHSTWYYTHFCLIIEDKKNIKNSMDWGDWWATVHDTTKSQTGLSNWASKDQQGTTL